MPKLVDISKKWGYKTIFDKFCLEIQGGKTTALIGKSGAGKTTALSIIANLTDYEGRIESFGEISYVFQEPRLIPFLTVKENLQYALKAVYEKEKLDKTIDEYLNLTGIKSLENKRADILSGGEKQRVSLIRAFAYPSDTILLDEPFSSLDVGLKMTIIDLYCDLLGVSPKTALLVTHSIDEALYLADDIIFLENNAYKKFTVNVDKQDRTFGYEKDNTLRKELYSLFL